MGNCYSKNIQEHEQECEPEEDTLSDETTELILTYENLQRRRYSYPIIKIKQRERTLTE